MAGLMNKRKKEKGNRKQEKGGREMANDKCPMTST